MKIRSQKGSQLVEFPVALGVLILFVFLTLADLATLLLGVNNVHNAARLAATDGARGVGFPEIQSRVQAQLKAFAGGVEIQNTEISVFEVPVKETIPDPEDPSKTISLEKSKILPGPKPSIIDTKSYQYQIEVSVRAAVSPLVNLNSMGGFVQIPGLTQPLPVMATYSSLAEHPKGLSQ